MTKRLDELEEYFSPLLDDELDPETRATIEAELAESAEGLRSLDGFRRVDALYRGLEPVAAPDDFEVQVKEALDPGKPRLVSGRFLLTRVAPLAAAAAVLMVAGSFFWPGGEKDGRMLVTQVESEAPPAPEPVKPPAPKRESVAPPAPQAQGAAPETAKEIGAAGQEPPGAPAKTPAWDTPPPAMPPEDSAGQEQAMRMDMPTLEGVGAVAGAELGGGGASVDSAEPAEKAYGVDVGRTAADAESRADDAPAEHAPADGLKSRAFRPAPAKQPEPPAEAAGRRFAFHEDRWEQHGYAGQDTTPVYRGSERFSDVSETVEGMAEIAALGPRVIFRHEDTWYYLQPAEE